VSRPSYQPNLRLDALDNSRGRPRVWVESGVSGRVHGPCYPAADLATRMARGEHTAWDLLDVLRARRQAHPRAPKASEFDARFHGALPSSAWQPPPGARVLCAVRRDVPADALVLAWADDAGQIRVRCELDSEQLQGFHYPGWSAVYADFEGTQSTDEVNAMARPRSWDMTDRYAQARRGGRTAAIDTGLNDDEREMLNQVVMTAENEGRFYQKRDAKGAVDYAIKEVLKFKISDLREDAKHIRNIAIKEVQQGWKEK
jgi:hypothetical protein